MADINGSDHCFIGDLGKIPGWSKIHLTVCIGEIIGFHGRQENQQILYIHEYLIRKWGITDTTMEV